jgi:protein-tyrosine phosphatase
MRRYALESQYNMRDLGGYSTIDGNYTAYQKIFRSDCPLNVKESDQDLMKKLNITTVIDLRTGKELIERPSYFSNAEGVNYHNISFYNGNDLPKIEDEIAPQYFNMLEEKDSVNSIMKVVAEAEGNVLYHCAVGKDRTGMVSALILGICNVGLTDIIADYELSGTYIYELSRAYVQEYPELPEWFGGSRPEYMRDCLDLLIAKYGSFENYIENMEIPKEVIDGIRNKLL